MKYIKTSDLILGLNDLFRNKITLIQALAAYALFGEPLDDKRRVLAAIYRGPKSTPFVNRLKEKDAVHDGAGRILYFLCKNFERLPTLTDEERDFWYKLKETFVPSLSILKATYADKAAAATKRLELLAPMKSELEKIAIPNGMSLRVGTLRVGTQRPYEADRYSDTPKLWLVAFP